MTIPLVAIGVVAFPAPDPDAAPPQAGSDDPAGVDVVAALRSAGVDSIIALGATEEQASALGIELAHDVWPGHDEAGAVLGALHNAFLRGANTALVLDATIVAIDAEFVASLLAAAPGIEAPPSAVVVCVEGVRRAPNGVWQTRTLPMLEADFVEETDAVDELIVGLEVIEVEAPERIDLG